jgi:hypothetical protein
MLNHYILINTQTGETIKDKNNQIISHPIEHQLITYAKNYLNVNTAIAQITRLIPKQNNNFPGPTKL